MKEEERRWEGEEDRETVEKEVRGEVGEAKKRKERKG